MDLSAGVNQFLCRLLADKESDRWPAKAASKCDWLVRQAGETAHHIFDLF